MWQTGYSAGHGGTLRLLLLCAGRQRQPKTVVVVAVAKAVVVAISNATVRGIVVPTTAAQHTARAYLSHYILKKHLLFVWTQTTIQKRQTFGLADMQKF